jgi:hypothetical protein
MAGSAHEASASPSMSQGAGGAAEPLGVVTKGEAGVVGGGQGNAGASNVTWVECAVGVG